MCRNKSKKCYVANGDVLKHYVIGAPGKDGHKVMRTKLTVLIVSVVVSSVDMLVCGTKDDEDEMSHPYLDWNLSAKLLGYQI